MRDEERYRLIGGPYRSPRVKIGAELFCEIRGFVRCKRRTDGEIAWPTTGVGGRRGALIICGDLFRALRTESSQAVRHWWGVGGTTVARWKRQLGIGKERINSKGGSTVPSDKQRNPQEGVNQETEGTKRLRRDYVTEIFTPEVVARAHLRCHTPLARLKSSQTRRSGLRSKGIEWTAEQTALLGTLRDSELAQRWGCGKTTVTRRRNLLGIPMRVITKNQTSATPSISLSTEQLLIRRLKLNLHQTEIAKRAGLSQHTYWELECGFRRNVRLATLQGLARALQCRKSSLTA